MDFLYFVISFLASVVGSICGIGGGVIVKPLLDLFGLDSVSSISFLSGCMVLSMSFYSVGKAMLAREASVQTKTGTPLAIGAVIGGICGKHLFSFIQQTSENPQTAGALQAGCLMVITVGTLLYTIKKQRIQSLHVQKQWICVVIGFFLGAMSSFLGIGGGPINLVVLYYFFSMDSKTAASNSLYVILFSQLAGLITTFITNSVPAFRPTALIVMVGGGILGGIMGRAVNKKIDNKTVDRLFLALMCAIILISLRNTCHYLF